MKHLHRWLFGLSEGLDKNTDEQKRNAIIENCGRKCISRTFIKHAVELKNQSKTTEEFLTNLNKIFGSIKIIDGEVFVIYNECNCPIIKNIHETVPKTYCKCAAGWIKELFETVFDKEVQVIIMSSIQWGDDICKFKVIL